ncbi:MAG: glycosyltransferase [Actinobacteria bacterium]|nr:MAG: glycosyltransferase [Actinomycetota bacterium]
MSVQWVDQGWPGDVTRGIGSFRRRHPDRSIQHVVVDASRSPATTWPDDAEVLRMSPDAGWAAARNGALRRAAGSVILLVDGSIEATGDVITPLLEELAGGSTGVTGPFGVVTGDLREFRESGGPEVDAVEGYLMAFRRELVEGGLRFDEKFKFYRTADLELSFQIKAMGLRATVTPVPVDRHEHRMWANTPEDERARLSKRNFYRFLDKWRGRTDLLIEGRDSP